MRHIRALPASAGSLLGWNQVVWHWGARATNRGPGPRVSISLELQRLDASPLYGRVLATDRALTLDERLLVIAEGALRYEPFTELSPAGVALAESLVRECRG
jgi:ectoine hydroxylase-related dioxygenase (phytanoyl-CoA dioxygenase family)